MARAAPPWLKMTANHAGIGRTSYFHGRTRRTAEQYGEALPVRQAAANASDIMIIAFRAEARGYERQGSVALRGPPR